MTSLSVGQTVVLHDVNRRGADRVFGAVVKVGRKLVTIAEPHCGEQVYRIDTGMENGGYGHRWFCTLDEQAKTDQNVADRATLDRHGFAIKRWGSETVHLHAVAEFLRGME